MYYIGIDIDTHLIGPGAVLPKPVVLSISNLKFGPANYLVVKQYNIESKLSELLNIVIKHNDTFLVGTNISYDLGVAAVWFPKLVPLIFKALSKAKIKDVSIREKLLDISTIGVIKHSAQAKKSASPYSLAGLVSKYLNIDISNDKIDPESWRYRHAELENIPLELWPQAAIDYDLSDSHYARLVCAHQDATLDLLKDKFPYISMNTEGLQVAKDFCLLMCTNNGLHIDLSKVQQIKEMIKPILMQCREVLLDCGFASLGRDGKWHIKTKLLREFIEANFPHIELEYTASGKVSTNGDFLAKIDHPVPRALVMMSKCQKLETTYVPVLENGTIWPCYDPLKETGRTGSYGSKLYPGYNIQNQPRGSKGSPDDRAQSLVRECIVPSSKGNIFIACDYAGLELKAVAQVCQDLFGFSGLKDMINSGDSPTDIHSVFGKELWKLKYGEDITWQQFKKYCKDPTKDAKEMRQKIKAIDLAIPGGRTAANIAKGYRADGGDMSDEEAIYIYENAFLALAPEIKLALEWVRSQQFANSCYVYHTRGRARVCNKKLDTKTKKIKSGYCACANGKFMQSLSADGASLAVCAVQRACLDTSIDSILLGCKFVAFIHDEIIIECPRENFEKYAKELAILMIKSMQKVLPCVRIDVEWNAMEYWTKHGPFLGEGLEWKEPSILENSRG